MARKALGRGLESLISGAGAREIHHIQLGLIKPNPFQPRHSFNADELKELSASIKENGVIQPIIVRRSDKQYEIIAGERRFRAAKMAGMKDIPAVIKDIDNEKMLQIAIVENVQREDLNPVDEAKGYMALVKQFNMTHEQIGVLVGKSRSHISNLLRILELNAKIHRYMENGSISLGHAKVLLSVNKSRQAMLADEIVKKGMSVRELEHLVKAGGKSKKTREKIVSSMSYIEDQLSKKLNRKVQVSYTKGKGRVSLAFYSDDDFNELLAMLGIKHID